MSRKQEVDKTAGNELNTECAGKCSGSTYHNVIKSVDISGYEEIPDIDWDHHFQIIQCQGCRAYSFRDLSYNSETLKPIGNGRWEPILDEKLYPSRVSVRDDLGLEILLLPENIRRIYTETLQALNSNSPILAGIGLRSIIESVCKEQAASGASLYQKIDDLVLKNVLTPTGANILHKIRTLGNVAAHEVKPHSDTQLALAMDVTQHVLKDVYVLPKKIESAF